MFGNGNGVVVAVIDTGCDTTHSFLKDNIIGTYSVLTGGMTDADGHGTHVSGIVRSVAPECKLLPIRAIGRITVAGMVAMAIRYAIKWRGPKGETVSVINMSLSGPFIEKTLHDAIKEATAAGIICVAAAGNDGDGKANTDEIRYPGAYPEVISVGAVDSQDKAAGFSNSNNEVDISAPGVRIWSTIPVNAWTYKSGTSMAAPYVSGTLAVLIEAFQRRYGRRPTVDEARAILYNQTSVPENYEPNLHGVGVVKLDYNKWQDFELWDIFEGGIKVNVFEGYLLTSPFGWRMHPVYKERRFHTGVDLVKPHQDPIYAFTEGVVKFASMGVSGSGFGNYGNVVAIEDRDGCLHCYAHLDSIVVKVGAKVDRGQMIGRQGKTGIGTGSHLHYEVRKKNGPGYGFVEPKENMCHEPTSYLKKYYDKYYPATIPGGDEDVQKVDIPVVINGQEIKVRGIFDEGVNYGSIRDVAQALGFTVGWDGKRVIITGEVNK